MKPGKPGRYSMMRWPLTSRAASGRWEDRLRLRDAQLLAAWATFLGRVPWDVFVTLTFDPKRRRSVPQILADKEAFWFTTLASRTLRRPLGWAYAVEPGGDATWHAHVLIIGAQVNELRAVAAVWKQANGFVVLKQMFDAGAVLYTSKHAAVRGELVLSDTIDRYLPVAGPTNTVSLYPESDVDMAEGASGR
jgi:hypothetical protein